MTRFNPGTAASALLRDDAGSRRDIKLQCWGTSRSLKELALKRGRNDRRIELGERVVKLAVIALWTVLGVAVASFPASAEIAGQYVVNGHEPNSGGNYKGEAAVKKEGTTYHIMWVIGQQVSIGTGILSDKTLSITYMTRGSPVPGLAVYNVEPDGTLVGRFTLLGSKQMGAEAWTPIER